MATMVQSSGPGDGQKLSFVLTVNPPGSTIDGVPVYTIADGTLATVQNLSADGMSGEIVNLNVVGSTTLHVEGDADLGSGVSTISFDEPIDVTARAVPPATGFGLTFTAVPA